MISNYTCGRGHFLRKAFRLTVLILLLAGNAGAAPYAYITNKEGNSVSVIDTATNTVTATVNMLDYPFGVAVNPAGTKVYVAHMSLGWVSVIDTETNTVTATVYVGSSPNGIAVNPAGTKVYVTTAYDNIVSVIDAATNTITATVNVGNNPWGIVVNPAGTKVYVANWDSNTVSVIDTATNTVTATVNVESNPSGITINPDGTKVYVVNYGSGTVSVIDTATNTVTATVNIGSHPYGVAVNPTGTKVYSTNSGSNTVSVIDAATNTVTATVNVESHPLGVIVNPAGTNVYVANYFSGTVSVIDAATNTVTATVNVGSGAAAFGQFISPADTTPPSIEIITPTNGASYILNQHVASEYNCNDTHSGVATCIGTVANGEYIDTSIVGSKSFTITATDYAGNTASLTNNYNVIYNFNGFFRPVDNFPTLNTLKAGSAIPMKFSLNGNQGLNIFPAGYPKSMKISCDTSAPLDEIEETVTSGQSSLSYDAIADQYNYVWKTDKAWTGTCRQMIVKLNDGIDHTANFKFR